jgi:hypothetical protein
MVAQQAPTTSTMALPHGPAGVAGARRRLRGELCSYGVPEPVVDDAALILSELVSNAYRHARPLAAARPEGGGAVPAARTESDAGPDGTAGADEDGEPAGAILAAWRIGTDGLLTLEVTDGGGPTRPSPASPSLTARGGRGLGIVRSLALRWGVRDAPGAVTVWATLAVRGRHARRDAPPIAAGLGGGLGGGPVGPVVGPPVLPLDLLDAFDDAM